MNDSREVEENIIQTPVGLIIFLYFFSSAKIFSEKILVELKILLTFAPMFDSFGKISSDNLVNFKETLCLDLVI